MNFVDSSQNSSRNFVEPRTKSKILKTVLIGVFAVLFLGSVAAASFFYLQWMSYKNNPEKVSQDENKALIDQVSKIILLPTTEQPTIATVTDLSALKSQAFFNNAKLGDKVLVYQKAKTAYLFDPYANKIINVTSISDQPAAQAQDQIPNQTQQAQPNVSGASISPSPIINK